MERIYTLIDKLYQQKQQAASPAHLLFTVRLLQQELLQLQDKNTSLGTRKVAVTLPVNLHFPDVAEVPVAATPVTVAKEAVPVAEAPIPVVEIPVVETPKSVVAEFIMEETPVEEKEIFVLEMTEEEQDEAEAFPAPVEEKKEEPGEYTLRKPVLQESLFEEPRPVAKEEPRPVYMAQQLFNSAFDAVAEAAPTLAQYQSRVEVNEVIAEKKESLNDKLKQEKTEVAQLLKETPIKDLRKGIGINDRFVFVRELFRGDEAMYERSIKTINNFNIFSEAEYWIARELKHKLGWDDRNETVQYFYHLVRRRFS